VVEGKLLVCPLETLSAQPFEALFRPVWFPVKGVPPLLRQKLQQVLFRPLQVVKQIQANSPGSAADPEPPRRPGLGH
jgi:hypothetical protein